MAVYVDSYIVYSEMSPVKTLRPKVSVKYCIDFVQTQLV